MLSTLALAIATFASTQPAALPPSAPELYRFVLIQAAPGRLLDLIELYRTRLPVIAAGGDEVPFIVRHSQGDRWDLCVIYPSGSFTAYYGADRMRKRDAAAAASGITAAQFAKQFYDLVAWHEDVYVEGPPLATFRSYVKDLGLLHLEMFQALAGKRDALIDERKRESAFNRARSRPEALLFTHEQGAAWDVITMDGFRNWRHYAESETIPADVNDAAAKTAGFADVDAVGPYLRSLIALHHDTLATPVK